MDERIQVGALYIEAPTADQAELLAAVAAMARAAGLRVHAGSANREAPAAPPHRPASLSETPDAPSYTPATVNPIDGPPSLPQRAALAELALQRSLRGAHRESVIDLVERAWGDGALLHDPEHADAWPQLSCALLFVDALERAVEIAEAAERFGHTPSAPHARAAAVYARAWTDYHRGRIHDALAGASASIAGAPDAARAVIAASLVEQGRLDDAELVLAMLPNAAPIDLPVLLDVRAQLRLAQMRPEEALEDALEAGRRSSAASPGVLAWRSTAALALVALDRCDRARVLAEEELELARERGIPRIIIRDLRVLALAAEGQRRLALLSEAVAGAGEGARLEHARALVDFGAATRRANQRNAARDPLRAGLELAVKGGAAALAERARDELAATGARPRRVMLSGIEALTPSERRVADLAAGGLTTRQIARVLFVTPKTVEFHLRHVYRKLDIPSSRQALARAVTPLAPRVTPLHPGVAPGHPQLTLVHPDNTGPVGGESLLSVRSSR